MLLLELFTSADTSENHTDISASMAPIEIDPSNGLILKGVYIPEEILIVILSEVDPKTLVKCQRVCKLWRDIAGGMAWHRKVPREVVGIKHGFYRNYRLTAEDFYWMCEKQPFKRNLVKNPCGNSRAKNKFEHWTVTGGGDGWIVEVEPLGCDPLPANTTSCFVTSYSTCTAEQQIDLWKEGLTQNIMDTVKPYISLSEWYVARFDCGAVYRISVSLLNSDLEVVNAFNFDHNIDEGDRTTWKQVKYTFKHYGRNVRYIQFYHAGKDTQFWKGHYGAKMTGATVEVSWPDETNEDKSPSSSQSGHHSDIDWDGY